MDLEHKISEELLIPPIAVSINLTSNEVTEQRIGKVRSVLKIVSVVLVLTAIVLLLFTKVISDPPAFAGAISSMARSQGKGASINILMVGDWGQQGGLSQVPVAKQMGLTAGYDGSNMVISVGDNFYQNGVSNTNSADWWTSWLNIYTNPTLTNIPWWCVLGNHDYKLNPWAQNQFHTVNSRWNMPSRYYSQIHTYNGISVGIAYLDTNPFAPENYRPGPIATNLNNASIKANDPPQVAWLASTLQSFDAAKVTWKIVVGHHAIHSGGSHGDTASLVQVVKPLLSKYNVKAYLCGHDHTMQHIARDGLNFFVNGAGSQPEPMPLQVQGTQYRVGNTAGFAVINMNAVMLLVQFIDSSGNILYEAFINH